MRGIAKAVGIALIAALAGCSRAPERAAPVGTESGAAETATPTAVPTPTATETPTPTPTETPAPAPAEPAAPPAPAPAPAGGPDLRDDTTLWRWEDAAGDVHYSVASEVPRDRARTARPVTADVSTVVVEPIAAPPAAAKAPSGAIAESKPAAAQPPPPAPKPKPSTRHVDDMNRLYNMGLDAEQMDERYEQQKKDMKCRTVDGVVICG